MVSFQALILIFSTFQCLVTPAFAGYDFVRPQVRVTTTFADFDARIMDHWGGGGGKFVKISKDSKHPFEGRTFGGAKRKEIRGTRAFGSGYPYGMGNHSMIARRPFPFGTWPLYWDQNFLGSDEYGPQHDGIRPGGFLAYAPLRTTTKHFNTTNDEVYYAIGDRESLLLLMISYVTWCHATPAWPVRFDPTSPNTTIKVENVIQYFRASSFALASPAYNNTFAWVSNSEAKESTPLPEYLEYSPFRKCVDGVTEKALAIMNKPPGQSIDGILITVFCSTWFICAGILFVIGMGTYYGLRYFRSRIFPDPSINRNILTRKFEYETYP